MTTTQVRRRPRAVLVGAVAGLVLSSCAVSVVGAGRVLVVGASLAILGSIAGLVTANPRRSHLYGWAAVSGVTLLGGPAVYLTVTAA